MGENLGTAEGLELAGIAGAVDGIVDHLDLAGGLRRGRRLVVGQLRGNRLVIRVGGDQGVSRLNGAVLIVGGAALGDLAVNGQAVGAEPLAHQLDTDHGLCRLLDFDRLAEARPGGCLCSGLHFGGAVTGGQLSLKGVAGALLRLRALVVAGGGGAHLGHMRLDEGFGRLERAFEQDIGVRETGRDGRLDEPAGRLFDAGGAGGLAPGEESGEGGNLRLGESGHSWLQSINHPAPVRCRWIISY